MEINRFPEMGWVNYDFIQYFENTYPQEEVIYHFTSPDGMIGILGNDSLKLRFSRITCLNDYSEGLEVVPLYKSVCTRLRNQHLINEDFFKE